MLKGTRVRLTKDAKENYADYEWVNDVLVIESEARRYMPAKEFCAKGRPNGYHPGYDEGAGAGPLYDFEGDINCSLYGWEVVRVP